MIDLIREYFNQVIKEANPELVFDGYVFGTEKTSIANIGDTYKLVIGAMSTTKIDTNLESTIRVTVIIYRHSTVDFVVTFDDGYHEAICIQASACSGERLDQDSFIKGVTSTSITPEPIENDDNLMKFTIEFDVKVSYWHEA